MHVGLFIPCYVNHLYPQTAIAALELLENQGIQVSYPADQTCCGQVHANAGMEKDALSVYAHFVKVFENFDYIVSPSGSCTAQVQHQYAALPQTPAVQKVRERTMDLSTFLQNIIKTPRIEALFPHKVALHTGCHGLRSLGLDPRPLLANVEGLELISLQFPDECCGFGGTYAITEPELSAKMGRDKLADCLDKGAEYICSTDQSCLMHLEGLIKRQKLPLKVIHLAELLTAKP